MSQRSADEIENRRGLVLGLTLAELLLLVLFLLILALGWRMTSLEKQKQAANANAEKLARDNISIRATLGTLEPLIAELKKKGGLDISSAEDFVARLGRLETLGKENAELLRARSELMADYTRFKAIMPDSKAIKAIENAIAAAAQIDPDDPPAVLTRAAEIMKQLGTNAQPEQIKPLVELRTAAAKADPADPLGATLRAAEILKQLGPNITPERLKSLIEISSSSNIKDKLDALEKERDKYRQQVTNMIRTGNGLTYPSCWTTAEGLTEYIFDVTIRDNGLVVRDATPSRAEDPQMKLVQDFERGALMNEALFQRSTQRLFNWSRDERCRFYAIVRDDTGPTSKKRYKELRTLVEGHFYPLHLAVSTPAPRTPRPPTGRQESWGVGGPFVPVPPKPVR